MDDWHTTWTAKSCAKKYLFRQEWKSKRLLGQDYKAGFIQAFVDIAQGGNGEVPAVPPPKFWNTHFRSTWGQKKAELWFDGYRAGAAIAGVEMLSMRQVAASADWTVDKQHSPFASQANFQSDNCPTNYTSSGMTNGGSLLNPQPAQPFRSLFSPNQSFGPPGPPNSVPYMQPPGPQQFGSEAHVFPGAMMPGPGHGQYAPPMAPPNAPPMAPPTFAPGQYPDTRLPIGPDGPILEDGPPRLAPQRDSGIMGPGYSGPQSGGPGTPNPGLNENQHRPSETGGQNGSGLPRGSAFQPGHSTPSQLPGTSPRDGLVY